MILFLICSVKYLKSDFLFCFQSFFKNWLLKLMGKVNI